VLVHVVHRLEQLVDLLGGRIKLQPLPVGRQADAVRRDARLLQPLTDGVDAVLSRGEELDNVFLREPLAVVEGLVVRATRGQLI
jgi:hypothetical protein